MRLSHVSQHRSQIGRFNAQALLRDPVVALPLERVHNGAATRLPHPVPQRLEATVARLRVRTPVQVALVLLAASSVMGGAAAAAGLPASPQALQREALQACGAVTRTAEAPDFTSTFPTIAADVQRLEQIACDSNTLRNNVLAIARCLGRVHRKLEKHVAMPLRRRIVRAEAPAVSVDDALRVVRLGIGHGQLEAVMAMEHMLTQAIERANAAFLARVG